MKIIASLLFVALIGLSATAQVKTVPCDTNECPAAMCSASTCGMACCTGK